MSMEEVNTVQKWLLKVQKMFVEVPEAKRVTSEFYHTLREIKTSLLKMTTFIFNRSIQVVVQECDHENDADRLIKVCQM